MVRNLLRKFYKREDKMAKDKKIEKEVKKEEIKVEEKKNPNVVVDHALIK